MTSQEIALRRLSSQQIGGNSFTEPAGLVRWMGCIQAEDLAGAKWAIGNRVTGSSDDSIGQDLDRGLILRTHVLQPSWQFITPGDIHWMLALTAPRLKAFNKGLHRLMDIDDRLLRKSRGVIAGALKKEHLTRTQVAMVLEKEGVHTNDLRLGLLLMDAELEGLICSGRKENGHFTYALLEERAPLIIHRSKEESIADLAKRYFYSRGPATVLDFTVWSGLRHPEVRIAMEMNKDLLASEVINGQVYWYDPNRKWRRHDQSLFLLPGFDELATAYANNDIFKPMVIADGQLMGTWSQVLGKDAVSIDMRSPVKRDKAFDAAMLKEVQRYSAFLGRKLSRFNNRLRPGSG